MRGSPRILRRRCARARSSFDRRKARPPCPRALKIVGSKSAAKQLAAWRDLAAQSARGQCLRRAGLRAERPAPFCDGGESQVCCSLRDGEQAIDRRRGPAISCALRRGWRRRGSGRAIRRACRADAGPRGRRAGAGGDPRLARRGCERRHRPVRRQRSRRRARRLPQCAPLSQRRRLRLHEVGRRSRANSAGRR